MADKGAKGLALLLGMPKKGASPAEAEGEDEEDVDVGASRKEAAAGDLISALKSDDAAGVAAAFKEMYAICADEHGDYEEPEEVA